jgi:Mg2+ and Co2+ transporter CorA
MATSASQEDDFEPTAEILAYYKAASGNEVQQTFRNLDEPISSGLAFDTAQDHRTFNFVLDFSDDAAWVAFDLHPLSVAGLLDSQRPEVLNTRWINIWYPSKQSSLLELLAKRYDFTPRLLALMCSEPKETRTSSFSLPPIPATQGWFRQHRHSDIESKIGKESDELTELSSLSSYDSTVSTNLYKIIGDLWHYTSVDFGRNYVCVGYNSLYGTKQPGDDSTTSGPLPHCNRVWTWLLLCSDNTVISIHEDPFPFSSNHLTPFEQRILAETRRNLTNVFRSLSLPDSTQQPALSKLPLRARLGSTPEETAHRPTDIPGLLFYYLFENWHNSYTLITRRESRYGLELNTLRAQMFQSPKLCHIDRLDSIGKELGVLKRHYSSYNRIIDRLLEPPSATSASLQNSLVMSEDSHTSLDTIRPIVPEKESLLGISLSSAARMRLKRLHDLIDLYALSEVEEYIKQKDSLVSMNFQLIAIKESMDVERLTRLTLLLTKISMIFLPVSLMTGYFSVPLMGMEYSVTEFWTAFAVVMCISGGMLFLIGVFSGTVQTFAVLQAAWKGVRRFGTRVLDRL